MQRLGEPFNYQLLGIVDSSALISLYGGFVYIELIRKVILRELELLPSRFDTSSYGFSQFFIKHIPYPYVFFYSISRHFFNCNMQFIYFY